MNSTITISTTAHKNILANIFEFTKLHLNLDYDLFEKQSITFERYDNINILGIFDAFLDKADFTFTYYADSELNKLRISYDCKISYKGGGSNGFTARYDFNLTTGKHLQTYY
jgi:hypothetical protein